MSDNSFLSTIICFFSRTLSAIDSILFPPILMLLMILINEKKIIEKRKGEKKDRVQKEEGREVRKQNEKVKIK